MSSKQCYPTYIHEHKRLLAKRQITAARERHIQTYAAECDRAADRKAHEKRDSHLRFRSEWDGKTEEKAGNALTRREDSNARTAAIEAAKEKKLQRKRDLSALLQKETEELETELKAKGLVLVREN